jgi:uncharacterized protein
LVELERSGVKIDACRECRGVWLDRGELDGILERERKVVGAADDDDDNFMREITGGGKSSGLDSHTAKRIYSDYRTHKKQKKRKSFLDELFD